jgi:hypothetical protein
LFAAAGAGHGGAGDGAGVEDAGAVDVQGQAVGRDTFAMAPTSSTGIADPPPTWWVFSIVTDRRR